MEIICKQNCSTPGKPVRESQVIEVPVGSYNVTKATISSIAQSIIIFSKKTILTKIQLRLKNVIETPKNVTKQDFYKLVFRLTISRILLIFG